MVEVQEGGLVAACMCWAAQQAVQVSKGRQVCRRRWEQLGACLRMRWRALESALPMSAQGGNCGAEVPHCTLSCCTIVALPHECCPVKSMVPVRRMSLSGHRWGFQVARRATPAARDAD